MAFTFQDELIGLPAIGQVDTAARSPAAVGMLAHAVDPSLGGGEFVYLPGVLNCAAGSLVTYNGLAAGTALGVVGAHGSSVAVAMAATGAGQYGWFQISGQARIAKTATAATAGHGAAVSGTAGQVADIAVATPLASGTIDGCVVAAAALSGDATVTCILSRPTVA